jgi:hypothetical protein
MSVNLVPVLIANGTALSAAIPLGPKELQGISMPAAWTAATLTYQVSIDGTTFETMTDSTGTAIQHGLTAPGGAGNLAGLYLALDPTLWRGISLIKIQSSQITAGTGTIAQGADRTLNLVTQ